MVVFGQAADLAKSGCYAGARRIATDSLGLVTMDAEQGPNAASHTPNQAAASREFGKALSQARYAAGMTQEALAEQLDVSRATIAQWESARHLPAPERARDLDELLAGGGKLAALVDRVRAARSEKSALSGWPSRHAGRRLNLVEVFGKVADSLCRAYARDDGWRHELENPYSDVSPLATAYGAKTMLLLQDVPGPTVSFSDLLDKLLRAERIREGRSAGWTTNSSKNRKPNSLEADQDSLEATAVVLDAISRLDPTRDLRDRVKLLEQMTADTEPVRPTVLCIVLDSMLRIDPYHAFVPKLVNQLLAARGNQEDGAWRERNDTWLADPKPSMVHTARAIRSLSVARRRAQLGGQLKDKVSAALDKAVSWLTTQDKLVNVLENLPGRGELFPFRHFTAAWVARALVEVGQYNSSNNTSVSAYAEIWNAYHPPHGLWRWDNGELPIWMTFDAVECLRLIAFQETLSEPVNQLSEPVNQTPFSIGA